VKDPRFAEHLSVFLDVARAGSFSGAARRRNVTPSAIVRQIDTLEADLGTPLFVRSTRALALTEAGQLALERAQPILDELVDLRAEVLGLKDAVAGTLRLACFPTFGKRYVIPVMHRLMTEYPDLRVELDLTERLADPVVERLDAVIRIGHLQDSTLISSKIASDRRLMVAAPAYLARDGMPLREEIVGRHLLDKLHGPDLMGWRHVIGCPTTDLPASATIFRCDDFEALRQAALRGMGITIHDPAGMGDRSGCPAGAAHLPAVRRHRPRRGGGHSCAARPVQAEREFAGLHGNVTRACWIAPDLGT